MNLYCLEKLVLTHINLEKEVIICVKYFILLAQKFVKSLLAVDPKNRLTVEQALQNEWITSKGKKVIITDFYSNLQQTSKL